MEMIEQEMNDPSVMPAVEPNKEPNDHEGSMARGELRSMIDNGNELYDLIHEDDELPGWVSAYITLASDYMNSVAGYMREKYNSKNTEVQSVADAEDFSNDA